MKKPIKLVLYHGTNANYKEQIQREGIQPREETGVSNYSGKVESKKGLVYLTTAWPFYYGFNAIKNNGNLLIVRVEISEWCLYPDEDFLAASKHQHEGVNLLDATKQLDPREYQHHLFDAIKALGNVASKPVEPNLITEMIEIPKEDAGKYWFPMGADSNPYANMRFGFLREMIRKPIEKRLELLFKKGWEAVKKDIDKERKIKRNLLVNAESL